jgi:hypothetical protein
MEKGNKGDESLRGAECIEERKGSRCDEEDSERVAYERTKRRMGGRCDYSKQGEGRIRYK